MIRMLSIKTDGTVEEMAVPDDGNQLAPLQAAVGGYIEHVNIDPQGRVGMYVNEESLLVDVPVINPIASLLYRTHLHKQPICGDVVICAEDQALIERGEADFVDDPDLAMGLLRLIQVRLREAMLG